jgi:hypothetical protein
MLIEHTKPRQRSTKRAKIYQKRRARIQKIKDALFFDMIRRYSPIRSMMPRVVNIDVVMNSIAEQTRKDWMRL